MNSIDQIIRKLLEEEHDLLSEIDKYREEGDVESEIFCEGRVAEIRKIGDFILSESRKKIWGM